MKPSKLQIRNKNPGTMSVGANTEVLLDGKILPGVKRLSLDIEAGGLASVKIEMVVDIEEIDGHFEIGTYEKQT